MKKALLIVTILSLIGLFFITLANAGQVTLTWDANDPAPTGYRIYSRTGADYGTVPAWDGTATTCTITVPDGIETAFVARAYVVGQISGAVVESANSNEVTSPPAKPNPPQNFMARLLAAVQQWFRGLFA